MRRRQLAWVAGISAIAALLAVWTFAIDWEWSYNGDDASWVTKAREASSGNFVNWWTYLGVLIAGDTLGWGLFRPFYQFSSLLIYELPTAPAHALRVAMYLLLLATPILIVIRGTKPGRLRLLAIPWVSALFLAGYTIIYGVYFVSLQEFTGMALVAGGLLSRNSYIRGFLWLLAGWTKAPFIWISIAFGVQNLLVKSRRLGLVFLSLGVLSVSVMALSAQLGSYTSGRLILSPWHLWANAESLGTYGALFLFVLVIGLFLFAPCIKVTGETVVLLLAALLYAANLLPWNTIGYYNAPVWFLLTCAVATAIKPSSDKVGVLTTKWTLPIMVGCLAASGLLAAETFRTDVLGRNQMVVEGRDWILNNLQPNESYFIYDFSNAEFQFYLTEKDPTWTRDTPQQWMSGQPRPTETLDADYVVATNEVPLAPELTECAPIKVWTRGFLAPLNC